MSCNEELKLPFFSNEQFHSGETLVASDEVSSVRQESLVEKLNELIHNEENGKLYAELFRPKPMESHANFPADERAMAKTEKDEKRWNMNQNGDHNIESFNPFGLAGLFPSTNLFTDYNNFNFNGVQNWTNPTNWATPESAVEPMDTQDSVPVNLEEMMKVIHNTSKLNERLQEMRNEAPMGFHPSSEPINFDKLAVEANNFLVVTTLSNLTPELIQAGLETQKKRQKLSRKPTKTNKKSVKRKDRRKLNQQKRSAKDCESDCTDRSEESKIKTEKQPEGSGTNGNGKVEDAHESKETKEIESKGEEKNEEELTNAWCDENIGHQMFFKTLDCNSSKQKQGKKEHALIPDNCNDDEIEKMLLRLLPDAFSIWQEKYRDLVKKEYPCSSKKMIEQKLKEIWIKLPEHHRRKYYKQATDILEKYKRSLEENRNYETTKDSPEQQESETCILKPTPLRVDGAVVGKITPEDTKTDSECDEKYSNASYDYSKAVKETMTYNSPDKFVKRRMEKRSRDTQEERTELANENEIATGYLEDIMMSSNVNYKEELNIEYDYSAVCEDLLLDDGPLDVNELDSYLTGGEESFLEDTYKLGAEVEVTDYSESQDEEDLLNEEQQKKIKRDMQKKRRLAQNRYRLIETREKEKLEQSKNSGACNEESQDASINQEVVPSAKEETNDHHPAVPDVFENKLNEVKTSELTEQSELMVRDNLSNKSNHPESIAKSTKETSSQQFSSKTISIKRKRRTCRKALSYRT